MNNLQAVAFKPSAYDPVAHRNSGKEKQKEIVKHQEAGDWEQNFIEHAFRIHEPGKAETAGAEQGSQQQGNEGTACERHKFLLPCSKFLPGIKITTHREKTEEKPLCAEELRPGSRTYFPFRFSSGNPAAQGMTQFMKQDGQETEEPDKQNSYNIIHGTIPLRSDNIPDFRN